MSKVSTIVAISLSFFFGNVNGMEKCLNKIRTDRVDYENFMDGLTYKNINNYHPSNGYVSHHVKEGDKLSLYVVDTKNMAFYRTSYNKSGIKSYIKVLNGAVIEMVKTKKSTIKFRIQRRKLKKEIALFQESDLCKWYLSKNKFLGFLFDVIQS